MSINCCWTKAWTIVLGSSRRIPPGSVQRPVKGKPQGWDMADKRQALLRAAEGCACAEIYARQCGVSLCHIQPNVSRVEPEARREDMDESLLSLWASWSRQRLFGQQPRGEPSPQASGTQDGKPKCGACSCVPTWWTMHFLTSSF